MMSRGNKTSTGWPTVPLGDLVEPVERREVVKPDKIYDILGAHWYAKGLYIKATKPGSQIRAKYVYRVEKADFVYNRLFAWKGSFAVATEENSGCYVSNEFPCFVVDQEHLDSQYLWYYFSRATAWNEALGLSSGGTPTSRNRLKEARLLAMCIPLPPLEEQRRIVARIEELAAKVEAARALRQQATEGAEALGGGILAKAYDEAAEIAGGTERLDDLCRQITDGTHSTPTYVMSGVPFLSVKDITTGDIRFDDARFITPEEHEVLRRRCKPEFGDVLLTKVGTTGFAKAIDVHREFSIFVSLALLKLDGERLTPEFTEYMLNSPRLREYSRSGTRGVGNKNLVLKFIREFPMPAPPLEEQHRIVAYLDALLAKVDAVKAHQAATAAALDALLPSILDQAFKGEL